MTNPKFWTIDHPEECAWLYDLHPPVCSGLLTLEKIGRALTASSLAWRCRKR